MHLQHAEAPVSAQLKSYYIVDANDQTTFDRHTAQEESPTHS